MPFIKAKDINIFYRAYLGGKLIDRINPGLPTMIVLHGAFGALDGQIEVEPWKCFSSHMQLIFPDRRGCGQSDGRDADSWSMDQFADDIVHFSDALGIRKPIVGGVSSGGYVSLAYGTKHPNHPQALVLVNTEARVDPEAKRQAFASLKRPNAAQAAAASYAYDMHPNVSGNFDNFIKYCIPLISKNQFEWISPINGNNDKMQEQFASGYRKFDFSPQLHKISCPVLWLAGDYDPLHVKSGAIEGAKLIGKNVDLQILDAGDPVYLDNQANFEEAVFNFIEREVKLYKLPGDFSSPSKKIIEEKKD